MTNDQSIKSFTTQPTPNRIPRRTMAASFCTTANPNLLRLCAFGGGALGLSIPIGLCWSVTHSDIPHVILSWCMQTVGGLDSPDNYKRTCLWFGTGSTLATACIARSNGRDLVRMVEAGGIKIFGKEFERSCCLRGRYAFQCALAGFSTVLPGGVALYAGLSTARLAFDIYRSS